MEPQMNADERGEEKKIDHSDHREEEKGFGKQVCTAPVHTLLFFSVFCVVN
jgi:hypothetical protein